MSLYPDSYSGTMFYLSQRTHTPVVCVDYRRTPEFSLDQQLSDCIAGYHFLTEERQVQGKDIVVMGDSAGGGLALAVLQHLVQTVPKEKQPCAAVLVSAFADMSRSGLSHKLNQVNGDEMIQEDINEQLTDAVLSSVTKRLKNKPADLQYSHPTISPVFGSFKGLPALYVAASETELLYSDNVMIVKRARKEGVSVFFESAPYGLHDFAILPNIAPEYNESFSRICDFIKSKFGLQPAFA